MNFDANHSRMGVQRQDSPVAKMSVQGDQDSVVGGSLSENVRVIGPTQPSFAGPDDIMAYRPQLFGQFHPEHLIEKEAHKSSSGKQFGDFRTDHAGLGKPQRGLDVGTGQFRVAFEQGVPGFTLCKLAEDDFHGYAGVLDHRPTATHAGMEFDAIIHPQKGFTSSPSFQALFPAQSEGLA